MTGWKRTTLVIVAMVACSWAFAMASPFLINARGGDGPSLLSTESTAAAIVAVMIAWGVSLVIAALCGRVTKTVDGLAILGVGIGTMAFCLDGTQELLMTTSITQIVVELVIWAVLVLAATVVIFAVSGPLSEIEAPSHGEPIPPLASREAVRLLIYALVAIPVVWIIARSDLRGQTLAATAVGGIAAGLLGRLLSPNIQPVLLPAGVCIAGIGGVWVGWWQLSGLQAIDAYATNALPPLLRPAPIDWAVGGLIGVPIGVTWAKSFLCHEDDAVTA
jgi:hypothetical protein